jgi:hypothetical protein
LIIARMLFRVGIIIDDVTRRSKRPSLRHRGMRVQ